MGGGGDCNILWYSKYCSFIVSHWTDHPLQWLLKDSSLLALGVIQAQIEEKFLFFIRPILQSAKKCQTLTKIDFFFHYWPYPETIFLLNRLNWMQSLMIYFIKFSIHTYNDWKRSFWRRCCTFFMSFVMRRKLEWFPFDFYLDYFKLLSNQISFR